MSKNGKWSREQLVIAIKLYCEIPFGKLHSRNPRIIQYAEAIGRSPSALAMKLTNFASLDPAITLSGRKGLSGASLADKAIWDEMTSNWDNLVVEAAKAESALSMPGESIRQCDDATEQLESYFGKTRLSEVETRVGQNFFRSAVLSAYGFRCCISRVSIPQLLIASHIVPWRHDAQNRLNPRNGLCLSAIHDCAFDQGLITISEEYRVRVSSKLFEMRKDSFISDAFLNFEGEQIALPEKFRPDPDFLKYHRDRIFAA